VTRTWGPAPGDWPGTTGVDGGAIAFADGTADAYDVVVWATGFTTDDSWVDVPDATDERGRLRQQRGITASPGLYTLGRAWQHTRGSALLGWVGDDAAALAGQIAARAGRG
jgi:putative flavoprotein involved in K+ transport